MIHAAVSFPSERLGMRVAMNVLLPEAGNGPFATLYLLHGLGDDHTIWHRLTRLEAYAWRMPLAIVMPQGFRGFYTRNDAGSDYASYIADEVVETAQRLFPLRRERAGRAIGGLSMGGYGALRVGLGWPDRFCSIASHSGAVMYGTAPPNPDRPIAGAEYARIFGSAPAGTHHDLIKLAADARDRLPQIRIDCGVGDYFIEPNREYHAALQAANIPHDYQEHAGAHDWDYWNGRLPDALWHHARAMGIVVDG